MSSQIFSQQVRHRFGRQADHYSGHAKLQRAIAWRLARHCLSLPLPPGPWADLGAGSGLVGQALRDQTHQARPEANAQAHPSLLQVDFCPELLACNSIAKGQGALLWDLNAGLPSELQQPALLTSSFALQWLDDPIQQLELWCSALRPRGWLALAVPTAGSFSQWHQAAAAAQVPFTGLALPSAQGLIAAARRHLQVHTCQPLRFSQPCANGLTFLREVRQLGASASRQKPLHPNQLRRLLQHWPPGETLGWEVVLLVGQRLTP
jgi:malonyl-CoA O-methyltransferase